MFEMSVPVTGKSGNETRATRLENEFEKRPDPVALTQNPDHSKKLILGRRLRALSGAVHQA